MHASGTDRRSTNYTELYADEHEWTQPYQLPVLQIVADIFSNLTVVSFINLTNVPVFHLEYISFLVSINITATALRKE
jgi:hypothetical protein